MIYVFILHQLVHYFSFSLIHNMKINIYYLYLQLTLPINNIYCYRVKIMTALNIDCLFNSENGVSDLTITLYSCH